MLLGRVIGTVWATRKDEKLEGLKLQIVGQIGLDTKPQGPYVVAVDAVGAGEGEVVIYATGSAARQTVQTDAKPVDAVIMAVIDHLSVNGEVTYKKE